MPIGDFFRDVGALGSTRWELFSIKSFLEPEQGPSSSGSSSSSFFMYSY